MGDTSVSIRCEINVFPSGHQKFSRISAKFSSKYSQIVDFQQLGTEADVESLRLRIKAIKAQFDEQVRVVAFSLQHLRFFTSCVILQPLYSHLYIKKPSIL